MEHGWTDQERIVRVETELSLLTRMQSEIGVKIDLLFTMVRGRPSWAVVAVLAFMQGIIGVLTTALVYVLTKG